MSGTKRVDRLVVGDAGAERIGDRDAAGAVGAHEAGNAEQRVGAELERVDEVVVEAAVDGMGALQPARGAHVEDVVAHDEVGGLDQLDAHLAREEGVLEVGGLAGPASRRRPSPRSRLRARQRAARAAGAAGSARRAARGRRRTARGPAAPSRAVLEHVGDAGGDPQVVLDHLPAAVAVAHEVAAGDVRVDAARRADPVHGARELRAGRDQPPWHRPSRTISRAW